MQRYLINNNIDGFHFSVLTNSHVDGIGCVEIALLQESKVVWLGYQELKMCYFPNTEVGTIIYYMEIKDFEDFVTELLLGKESYGSFKTIFLKYVKKCDAWVEEIKE